MSALDEIHTLEREDNAAYRKAKEATKSLLDATNGGRSPDVMLGVLAGILETHRYLQDKGIVAVLTALGEFGRLEGVSDARNEHAHKTCELLPTVLRDRIYWSDHK